MAVPKRRKSHSRTRTHRAHNALKTPTWITCPQCQASATLHQVCSSCGFYRGRDVMELSKEA